MISITWIINNELHITVDASLSQNLMEAAIANNIPNIEGECRGCLSCATCHVIIDQDWYDVVGPPGEIENEMLDLASSDRQPFSRLSCQISINKSIDGLVVYIP